MYQLTMVQQIVLNTIVRRFFDRRGATNERRITYSCTLTEASAEATRYSGKSAAMEMVSTEHFRIQSKKTKHRHHTEMYDL